MKRFDPIELHAHWAPYGWAVLLLTIVAWCA